MREEHSPINEIWWNSWRNGEVPLDRTHRRPTLLRPAARLLHLRPGLRPCQWQPQQHVWRPLSWPSPPSPLQTHHLPWLPQNLARQSWVVPYMSAQAHRPGFYWRWKRSQNRGKFTLDSRADTQLWTPLARYRPCHRQYQREYFWRVLRMGIFGRNSRAACSHEGPKTFWSVLYFRGGSTVAE